MAVVKIISNPYEKEVRYQKWLQDTEEWKEINYATEPNSKLLSEELVHGFFPFHVLEIVALLLEEYDIEDEKLEIIFEGTADEYKELEAVCSDKPYCEKIVTERSERGLENARDILPEVMSLSPQINSLIQKSVNPEKIKGDLNRIKNMESDNVPICVFGNYSSGKSTFINALIGGEILPSGTEPITAKVCKIERSDGPDTASIRCRSNGKDISIKFSDKETVLDSEEKTNSLVSILKEMIEDVREEGLFYRVSQILNAINDYESEHDDASVDELIEVTIPFSKGVLGNSRHRFVIFDTPGSNSASNAKHRKVLEQAMANMTNGLPIFLSTPDSLDSTDNENLYKMIREMDELDDRFTMIVVNKADGPGLHRKGSTESEQERILSQAVPRNLYSGGLFYVSSILGLGSKNGGQFQDDYYDETYCDQEYKYKNPEDRRYKTLYRYNIMPKQIKLRSDEAALKQDNLVYANSGLFSVESEIETFAGKYAAYNKYFQFQKFLKKVILITEDDIEIKKEQRKEKQLKIEERLKDNKRKLLYQLKERASKELELYTIGYDRNMKPYYDEGGEAFSIPSFKEKEKELTEEQKKQQGYAERKTDTKNAFRNIGGHLRSNVVSIPKKKMREGLKSIGSGFQTDVNTTLKSIKDESQTRQNVDRQVAEQLFKYAEESYKKQITEISERLDQESRDYWTKNTKELRELLLTVIGGSEALTEDRREELEQIIITYQPLTLESSPEKILKKDSFKKHVLFGKESNHLDINKLSRDYQKSMRKDVKAQYESVRESHQKSADDWVSSLQEEIIGNIVRYSPELSRQAQHNKNLTKAIDQLTERQRKLKEYKEELGSMSDWKVIH